MVHDSVTSKWNLEVGDELVLLGDSLTAEVTSAENGAVTLTLRANDPITIESIFRRRNGQIYPAQPERSPQ
jgi:hypothetical protein